MKELVHANKERKSGMLDRSSSVSHISQLSS